MDTVPYAPQEIGADSAVANSSEIFDAGKTVSNEVRDTLMAESGPLDIVLELVVGSSPVHEFEDRKSAQLFSEDPHCDNSFPKLR